MERVIVIAVAFEYWPVFLLVGLQVLVYCWKMTPLVVPIVTLSSSIFLYWKQKTTGVNLESKPQLKKRYRPKSIIRIMEPKSSINLNVIHNESSYRKSRIIRNSYNEHRMSSMSTSTGTRPNSQIFSSTGSNSSTPNLNNAFHRFSSITTESNITIPIQPTFGSQLSKRRGSMISIDDEVETEIKLTGLVDMDFEMNVDHSEEPATFQSVDGEDGIMTEFGEDTTNYSSYSENRITNSIDSKDESWHHMHYHENRNRLSLDYLNKLVKNSGNDNVCDGLKPFNLTSHYK